MASSPPKRWKKQLIVIKPWMPRRTDLALVDQLNQLLSQTAFYEGMERAERIIDLSKAGIVSPAVWPDWLKYQVKISLDTPSSSWERALQLTAHFQEVEAELWRQERESRKREQTAHHDLLMFKKDYWRLEQSEIAAYSILKEERVKVETYQRIIKYLYRELTTLRKVHKENTMNYTYSRDVPPWIVPRPADEFFNRLQGVQEVMDNIIDLKSHVAKKTAANKGTDSTISPPENWLSTLTADTYFICGPRHPQDPNPILHEYILISKSEKSVLLQTNLNEPEVNVRVDPIKFCSLYDLVEVLKDGSVANND